MKRIYWMLMALLLSTAAQSETASEQLSKLLTPMKTMTGQFVQQIRDRDNILLQEAEGEFVVSRPKKLFWKTTNPYEHLVVTDGQVLWLYDLDLEQATRQPFSSDLDQAPALLLSGEINALEERYMVSQPDANGQKFQLKPRVEGGVFKTLVIEFKSGSPTHLQLVDQFGQKTDISFRGIILNPAVNDAQFEFSPPDDVDVIINE